MMFKLNYGKFLRLAVAAGICGCFLVTLVKVSATETGGNYQKWQVYRDNLIKDTSLVRYYTFEEGKGEQVRNRAEQKEESLKERTSLTYFDLNAKQGEPSAEGIIWVEGRWPGKKAVRLDRCTLNCTEPCKIKNKSFTVECWVRKNGPGSIKGWTANGTILASGSGYFSGWRLTTLDTSPNGPIEFWLGRPKEGTLEGGDPLGVGTNPVSDGIWHYVVVTWNGEAISMYLDGLLKDTKKYSGDYFYRDEPFFRAGYSNYGVGSVKLDVDEVAIYGRALSAEEIKNHYQLLP